MLKKQQKEITLKEGKINEGTRQDRPRGQPVVEERNISWDQSNSESTEDEKEWSEEEFLLSYNDAPEWAKGLISFMKSSIKSIKISTRSVSTELQKVKDRQNGNEDRLDNLERAMQHVSDKVEEWVGEKAVLLGQINDLRARYDLKV